MDNKKFNKLVEKLRISKNYKEIQDSYKKFNEPNIFRILGIVRKEVVTHSNFLSWVLDPTQNHGLGEEFLMRFIVSCTGEDNINFSNKFKKISTEYTSNSSSGGERIDILIELEDLVVCIENKIDASESPEQLGAYKRIVENDFSESRHLFIYLTPTGIEPENHKDSYIPTSYKLILNIFKDIQKIKTLKIGLKIKNYIDAYTNILEREILNIDNLLKLSNELYKENMEVFDYLINLADEDKNKLSFIHNSPEIYNLIDKNQTDRLKNYISDALQKTLLDMGMLLRDSNNTYVRFTTKNIQKYVFFNKKSKVWGPKFDSFLFEFEVRPNNNLIRFKSTIGPCDENYDRNRLNEIIENMENSGTSKTTLYSHDHSETFDFDFDSILRLEYKELEIRITKIFDVILKIINNYELHFEKNKLELLALKLERW